jgi:hypothetical protein
MGNSYTSLKVSFSGICEWFCSLIESETIHRLEMRMVSLVLELQNHSINP